MGFSKTDIYLGEGKDYYSQRNNKSYPGSTCNVTSMVQALHLAGYKPEAWTPPGMQPEDSLMAMTESSKVNAERVRQKMDPGAQGIPNRQLHSLLSFATGLWTANPAITSFSIKLSVDYLLQQLFNRHPVVVSTKLMPDGHIVVLAGFRYNQPLLDASALKWENVEGFYLDDPWGDYTTKYKSQNGKKVFMPKADFLSFVKDSGSMTKWGHLFPKLAPKV